MGGFSEAWAGAQDRRLTAAGAIVAARPQPRAEGPPCNKTNHPGRRWRRHPSGLWPATAFAQAAWPSKPVRFVVPFAPGGSSEIIARATAGELSRTLGQSVFVDNKPGASGNIAMAEVARADDQHTLILGHIGTLAVNPYMYDKLPYDANKDFKPISLLAKVPALRRQSERAGEGPARVRRPGQEQAGPDELRLRRQRQRATSRWNT